MNISIQIIGIFLFLIIYVYEWAISSALDKMCYSRFLVHELAHLINLGDGCKNELIPSDFVLFFKAIL